MSETLRTARVPALEEVPGLVHGFEQRVAAAARDELSLADEPGKRDDARRRVASALERFGRLLLLKQVHGAEVRRAVAAAHAGWRGTAAGVARAAVGALLAGGSRPEDLVAATGPCIGPCCYEVGDELRAAFGEKGAEFFRPGPRGRPHLDVRAANERQLREAGIAESRIHRVADCTRCRADLYHSYRRDGKGAGRMINFVGFAG